jgi:hypothetical protein
MTGKIVGHGAKKRYYLDGREVTGEAFHEAFPDRPMGAQSLCSWKRPILSEALAVHPSQIAAVMERNRARGLHVHYDSEGRPELHDRGQRKALCEIERVFDKDGGYSDAQRKNDGKVPEPDLSFLE